MGEQNGVAAQVGAVLEQVAGGALRERPLNIRFWDGSELPATIPLTYTGNGSVAGHNGYGLGSGHDGNGSVTVPNGHGARPGDDVDGSGPGQDETPTAVIRSPRAVAYLLRAPGELGLGRAWVSGTIDFIGDLGAALDWRIQLREFQLTPKEWLISAATGLRAAGIAALRTPPRLKTEARQRGALHSLSRDRDAIHHHYDVSNDFYSLILGPTMVYSCAYFSDPSDSLEAAQERKLELICRKLQLRPGTRMLDIGCGWGSLILHAAKHHGVQALGVTLSERQADLARERIRQAGLGDRCEVRVSDYRDLQGREFDAIASVGMYEHVGREQLATYVAKVRQLLADDGVFLNHGITRLMADSGKRSQFISRFVFPDGDLHPIHELLTVMHEAGLEVRDVESMREHYALTLRAWVRNLEAGREQAIRDAGVEHERIWRLYMTGSAHAFAAGEISIFQTVAVKRGAQHRLPLDRRRLLEAPKS